MKEKLECFPSTWMPHPHYHFLCSVDCENGVKTLNLALQLDRSYIRNMCTKFQVDWTSTSSKTTSTKNFNLKRNRRMNEQTTERTDERTDAQTRKHNVHKCDIKETVI